MDKRLPEHESWLRRQFREKREWREHEARIKAMPPDYRAVMKLIQKYIFNFAADEQIMPVLYGIVDLLEEGAATGRPVLDVTGPDVAAFAWDVLMEVRSATWVGKKGAQLNAQVHAALQSKEPGDAS
jgi:DNA-binding ferritin-like protein (Dps family)